MSSCPISDEEAVAAADKEMEERANRAKALLSQRYVGLKRQQVRLVPTIDIWKEALDDNPTNDVRANPSSPIRALIDSLVVIFCCIIA